MSVKIIKEKDQAKGSFAGGLILENKPIGFPQDGGMQRPYSNLFYWANAWSKEGGLIGEHPHKMFEIMSFVLDGEIEHYDSKFDRWLKLKKGDVQIIRAGRGITHAERIMKNSRMFQIWFDPNIKKTIEKEASYNDYKADEMVEFNDNGLIVKNFVGNGGPVSMDAEGVVINEIQLDVGKHQLKLDESKVHSYYVLEGTVKLEEELVEHDFFIIENESEVELEALAKSKLFVISTPQQLTYKTYNELVKF